MGRDRFSRPKRQLTVAGVAVFGLLLWGEVAVAQPADPGGYAVGAQLSFGGRYDNVRICTATAAGVPGGPAGDLAFFASFDLEREWSVVATLPVFRPIVFAASAQVLQFEPKVTFERRYARQGPDVMVGPSLGLTLHYGPDYESEKSGAGRGPSFFAAGPMIGGYAGLDFDNDALFNVQLGISPYVTPLFGAGPDGRSGVVVGAMIDVLLRFAPAP